MRTSCPVADCRAGATQYLIDECDAAEELDEESDVAQGNEHHPQLKQCREKNARLIFSHRYM